MSAACRAAAVMLAALIGAGAGCAPPAPRAAAPMALGVNTHFEQGWPRAALAKVAVARAAGIREVVTWAKVETRPGTYVFTDRNSGFVGDACRRGLGVLVVVPLRNRIYGDPAIAGPAGRAGLAGFVAALVDRFPCIVGVELGNEINGPGRDAGARAAFPAIYTAALQAIAAALHPRHADVALVGGSALSVATGFLETLFGAGMLPLVDGVAVHPYAEVPEQLPRQLDHLRDVMARHGAIKPLWATEFGLYYETPEAAPPHALKVMAILSAAQVHAAYWYALLDEPWFPNMGLFAGPTPKPALDTFRLVAGRLLAAGDAQRVDLGDPLTFVYRFGAGPTLLWGSGRSIRFAPGAAIYDARGRRIAAPLALGPDPIVADAAARWQLEPAEVVADTLYDFGAPPWSLQVVRESGPALALAWRDSNWASYVGHPAAPDFTATARGITLGHKGASPPSLRERYTSPQARRLWLGACLEPGPASAVSVRIVSGGQLLYAGEAGGRPPVLALDLAAGQQVDILYTAHDGAGPAAMPLRRRIRLATRPDPAPPLCAPGANGATLPVNPARPARAGVGE